MEKKNLDQLFSQIIKDKYEYKVQNLKDDRISVVFQPKTDDEWVEIKKDCEIILFMQNYQFDFDDKFHIVQAIEADSIFSIFKKLFGPAILQKKKYRKTLLIAFLICLLVSTGSAFLLKIFGSYISDYETAIILGLEILAILFVFCFSIISLIFLNSQARKSWIFLILNSTVIDMLFIILIQNLNSSIVIVDGNLSNTIINILIVVLTTLCISAVFIFGSYAIRKNVIKREKELSHYFYLRNKILASDIDGLKKYSFSKGINISDLILSNDATNDIVGHLNMKLDIHFDSPWTPLLSVLFSIFFMNYFFGVLAPLTIASRIIMICFIFFRLASTTYNSIKKDKLILIFAIHHLEEILAGTKID